RGIYCRAFAAPDVSMGKSRNIRMCCASTHRILGREVMKRREFMSSALAAGSLVAFKFTPALARSGPIPDIAAVTADGAEITLRSAEVRDLAKRLHGQLLLAGDAGYDEA